MKKSTRRKANGEGNAFCPSGFITCFSQTIAMESVIDSMQQRANEEILKQKQFLKTELKDELKYELVTRELFEERFKGLDERFKGIDERFKGIDERFKGIDEKFKTLEITMLERFKVVDEKFKALEITMLERFKATDEKFYSLHFKMNIFITIALIALTFANPAFVQLIEKIF